MARLLLGLAFIALRFFGATSLYFGLFGATHYSGYESGDPVSVGIGVGLLAAALIVFIEFLRRR